jgi:DNA modification methylase
MKLEIKQGDVFDKLKEIDNDSIDLTITSPPYWGLRDYGVEGQLGAEPTMEAYLDNTMRWVKEIYRITKPTGSFVLNIGDCFVRPMEKGGEKQRRRENDGGAAQGWVQKYNEAFTKQLRESNPIYKEKQLLSVSSFAYCRIISETDFICRGEHIWAKPNVPSPIRSRLKHSHEKLFWFVKDADEYYFNPKAWKKKKQVGSIARSHRNFNTDAAFADNLKLSPNSCLRTGNGGKHILADDETIEHSWRIIPIGEKQKGFELTGKRKSEHIAPFPTELIRPYIKSMCPQEGIVLDPFLGSGTTMRVAMEEQRDCMGVELNKEYVEYSKARLNWGKIFDIEYIDQSLKKELKDNKHDTIVEVKLSSDNVYSMQDILGAKNSRAT